MKKTILIILILLLPVMIFPQSVKQMNLLQEAETSLENMIVMNQDLILKNSTMQDQHLKDLNEIENNIDNERIEWKSIITNKDKRIEDLEFWNDFFFSFSCVSLGAVVGLVIIVINE